MSRATDAVPASIRAVEDEWEDLVDRVQAPAFFRPGWIAAWWNAFGEAPLEVLTLRRDGRLAALLPVMWQGKVVRSPSNDETPHFGIVAEDVEAASGLIDELLERRPRRIELWYVQPDEPPIEAYAQASSAAGFRMHTKMLQRSPYLPVQGTWDDYWMSVSKNLRANLRRRRRNLEKQGTVTFEVLDGRERLDDLLDEGFAIEGSGWKERQGTSVASHPQKHRLFREAAAWAAERDLLRLAFLRLNGRAVAFDFNFEERGIHYMIKTGFDVAFHECSPGLLLRGEMVRRSFDEGHERYEFLGTDEKWKLDWAQAVWERVRLRAYAGTPAGTADWLLSGPGRDRAGRVKRRLLQVVGRGGDPPRQQH